MTPKLDLLPETLTVPRTDAIYNCHAYLTKVPVGAIKPFIEAFSAPGELVVDFFAGSGMTGLAAQAVGRRAALSDISALGRHIALGYLTQVSPESLLQAADVVTKVARKKLGALYMTRRGTSLTEVEMVRTVWSFTYRCPACAKDLVYFEHVTPTGGPPSMCPSCNAPFARRAWPRGDDVPVQVVARGYDGILAEQPISKVDRERIATARTDARLGDVPSLEIDESREMYSRSGLGKAGLRQTKDFFSARNAIALQELWQAIGSIKDEYIRQKLRFAFTAILARASRRYQWGPKRPLNAQNQTYYIAPLYYEWNIFELFKRKVSATIRASHELFGQIPLFAATDGREVTYAVASADKLSHLGSESVDYVFTDPPFGSNIFYSDMNLFHEAWLGSVTDPTSEAVVHTTGKRKFGSQQRYQDLLRRAFGESFRVLKPGRFMSVVFGNSSGQIWGLVQRALRESGFEPAPINVTVLDKGQRSVKGLNSGSEGVITVDLILTVRKPDHNPTEKTPQINESVDAVALIAEAIASLNAKEARNPSHVYARILRQAIQRHLPLDQLHLSDVLVALRAAGYGVDHKTGLLVEAKKVA